MLLSLRELLACRFQRSASRKGQVRLPWHVHRLTSPSREPSLAARGQRCERKRHMMGWTIFMVAVCILYDAYALQLAVRNGRHLARVVYGFYVPSAEIMTAVTIIQVYFHRVLVLPDVLVFALAVFLIAVAFVTMFAEHYAHRRSRTIG